MPPTLEQLETQLAQRNDPHSGRLPYALVIARQLQILRLYAQGKTPEIISIELNVPEKTVHDELTKAQDKVVASFAQVPPQHNFVRYATFQLQIVKKLQDLVDVFLGSSQDPQAPCTCGSGKTSKDCCSTSQPVAEKRQFTAAVSALKAQSDIYDKIYNKGKEFGVIQTKDQSNKAQQIQQILGQTHQDLRVELKQEITTLTALLSKVEDHDAFLHLSSFNPKKRKRARKVRKVKKSPAGVIRITPDWKFRH